jgi:hypothetical protein
MAHLEIPDFILIMEAHHTQALSVLSLLAIITHIISYNINILFNIISSTARGKVESKNILLNF